MDLDETNDDVRGRGSPGRPARGHGPGTSAEVSQRDYPHPSAGWGATRSVGQVLARSGEPVSGAREMLRMNHEKKGFDCPGCAWPDDRKGLHLDFCENGVKHATWEMTQKRVGREFFAAHTVTELSSWSDFALENEGRLTEPMRYDAGTDHYVPISWQDAFDLVGSTLRGLSSPDRATFYTSGRLSNEATFLYQLFVREYGTNNLPDCSNMCHEASGRALTAAIGTGKGTVDLDDWHRATALFIIGVNAASNAPRMLTALAEATRRGAAVVHVNPLVEAASRRTIVPHDFLAMGTNHATATGTMDVQPRIGGDFALMRGIGKAVLERTETEPGAIDRAWVDEHTTGFDDYAKVCAGTGWDEIVRQSGVSETLIRAAADVYIASRRTIFAWCLGISQQEHGVDTIREFVNVLLLKGNLGRAGAGPSPIRGHSNVQGNRTYGVNHRPTGAFLDKLDEICGITPPREHGLDTVASIEGMLRGEVEVFVGMGGNFVLAAPDTPRTFEALRACALTVQVSTKLNRSHLVHGRQALILPCIARSERDEQAAGPQGVSVEDAMSEVHLSVGRRRPASEHLRSEPAIIVGMARAALTDSTTPWQAYADDYDTVRDTMARVLPGFEDFNTRVRQSQGFRIAQPARELVFLTESRKAEFSALPIPDVLPPDGFLMLSTMRSHDQWNTSVYSDDDRYRGVKGSRTVVFLNQRDMARLGLSQLQLVDVTSTADDGSTRTVYGYRVLRYDIPEGSAAGYMPEMNVLCALTDVSGQSRQPRMKHFRVQVTPAAV
jgi:molybdopterin-dependent oxidoreductase alpha subunit